MTAAKLTQMTPAEKTATIAPNFPIQVPVPAGDVQRGEAQGGGAWIYELVVPGSLGSVERWYYDVYTASEWTLKSRTANQLTFVKGTAASQFTFESVVGASTSTKVTASIGGGTQILQTQ